MMKKLLLALTLLVLTGCPGTPTPLPPVPPPPVITPTPTPLPTPVPPVPTPLPTPVPTPVPPTPTPSPTPEPTAVPPEPTPVPTPRPCLNGCGGVVLTPSTTIAIESGPNGSMSPQWSNFGTSPTAPPPNTTPGPATSQHVIVVVEENHTAAQALAGMPYLKSIGDAGAQSSNTSVLTSGSLFAGYLPLWSGSTETAFGCNGTNCAHPITSNNIERELIAAGKTWKVYAESIPAIGSFAGDVVGNYAKRHNPAPWYSDTINSKVQADNMVGLDQWTQDLQAGNLPNLSFVVPNLVDDAHNGTLAQADSWLRQHIGPLLSSKYFAPGGDGVLIVAWDEPFNGSNCCVLTTIAGNAVKPGVTISAANSQCDILALEDTLLQIPLNEGCATGTAGQVFAPAFGSGAGGTGGTGGTGIGPYPDTRSGVLTQIYELPATVNISGIDPHPLVYPGFNGKIIVAYMPWFLEQSCSSVASPTGISRRLCFGSHVDIGANSNDPTYIHKDMNEIARRHMDGVDLDWEGVFFTGTRTLKHEEEATIALDADLGKRCNGNTCPLQFLINLDDTALRFSSGFASAQGPVAGGGFAPHALNSMTVSSASDVTNITLNLEDDLCYANLKYFGHPQYIKSGGHPIWQMFITEAGNLTGANSWQTIWNNVGAFNASLAANCSSFASVYAGSPDNGSALIELNGTQSAHDGIVIGPTTAINGAYLWDNLGGSGIGLQTSNIATALQGGTNYGNNLGSNELSAQMFGAWAGFDDQLAAWAPAPNGRLQDRACGTTWLNSLAHAGAFYNTQRQVPFVQVVTWNDFDEGTSLQGGVDNCFSLAATLNTAGLLSWTLTPTSTAATISTIDHITVFASTDGTTLGIIQDNIAPSLSGSVNLASLNLQAGIYTIYVKAWGKNSIVNHFATAGSVQVQGGTATGTGGGTASNPNPSQPFNPLPFNGYFTAASTWLQTQQLSDGAIQFSPTKIVPYDGNLAAMGWLQDKSQISRVLNYVKWYIAHLNSGGDVWGTAFTIYDYNISGGVTGTCVGSPSCTAGSTDNYGATFLSLVWNLYQTGDPTSQAYIRTIATTLDSIGTNVLLNQQLVSGRFKTLPGGFSTTISIMNNSEDYAGLRDMALLEGALGNTSRKTAYSVAATAVQNALQLNFNAATKKWAVSVDSVTGNVTNATLTHWSPDMVTQLWPVINGVVGVGDPKATSAYAQLNANWPTWPNSTFTSDGSDTGALPWAAVGLHGGLMSDIGRTESFFNGENSLYYLQAFPSPFASNDAGFVMRGTTQLIGLLAQASAPPPVSVTGLGPFVIGSNTQGGTQVIQPPASKRVKASGITLLGEH